MITILLLAAGRSHRFGPACKLQAVHRGKPLIRHTADAIVDAGFPAIAVVSDSAVADLLPEFRIVYSTGLQSQSLRDGLAEVTTSRVLIVLGDMPNVDAALLRRIAAETAPAGTTDGGPLGPPASFDRSMFAALQDLAGDRGARSLLRGLTDVRSVHVAAEALKDIDHPDQIL